MAKWLTSFGRKQNAPRTVLELMVLEGADAGQQFTVDGPEVRIGRGKPKTGQTGTILLCDTSVSSLQATIRADGNSSVIEHNPHATNPTQLNGRRVTKHPIKPGDIIEMGLVKIEVRQRQGIALSGLFTGHAAATEPLSLPFSEVEAKHRLDSAASDPHATTVHPGIREEAPTLVAPRGSLVVVRGLPELENKSFALKLETTMVGRSATCDVSVPEAGISRRHCRCEWEGGELVLFHLSETNSTCVNGVQVVEKQRLVDGDEILLADQVALRVELPGKRGARVQKEEPKTLPPKSAVPSLHQYMEEKIERDRMIEEEFSVTGSFVDIDVVGSFKMKAEADRPAHIIVSFERFRAYVESVIEEFDGQVLNSNGDELMCFFDSTYNAVRSASAILERLADFNERQNVLGSPFRFRIGVHTGHSLVDRQRGVAYSAVLDTAGHLQKEADVNGLLISADTLKALPEGLPFESAGTLEHDDIETFRATAAIE